jgi:hypothetical protein
MSHAAVIEARPQKSQLYTVRLEYCPDSSDIFTEEPNEYLSDWDRVFEIYDTWTLEQLASVIIDLLDWELDHLYEFQIGNRIYVHMGEPNASDFVVDTSDSCVSCAVMLNKLNLACGTKFNFIFDFGRYHIFRLTVLEILDFRVLALPFHRTGGSWSRASGIESA